MKSYLQLCWCAIYFCIVTPTSVSSTDDAADRQWSSMPNVMVAVLVRNKEHTLPWFLYYLENLDYPKQHMRLWLVSVLTCFHISVFKCHFIVSTFWLTLFKLLSHFFSFQFVFSSCHFSGQLFSVVGKQNLVSNSLFSVISQSAFLSLYISVFSLYVFRFQYIFSSHFSVSTSLFLVHTVQFSGKPFPFSFVTFPFLIFFPQNFINWLCVF